MLYVYLFFVALRQFIWNVLVWLDQGINTVFLLGDPDETISSVTVFLAPARSVPGRGKKYSLTHTFLDALLILLILIEGLAILVCGQLITSKMRGLITPEAQKHDPETLLF